MYASDPVDRIIEELEFIEAERRQFHENGPHFRIVHRSPRQLTPCNFHEKVAVYLIHRGRTFHVGLGTTLVTLFDYMACHNRLAQTARQIENGTRPQGPLEGRRTVVRVSSIPRRYVRVYADRIRAALGLAFRNAGLEVSPDAVLVSEETALNEAGYRLRGTFEWLHTAE